MTSTALNVRVLPDLPHDTARQGEGRHTDVTAPTDGATALDPAADQPAPAAAPDPGLRLLPGGGTGAGVDDEQRRMVMRARRFVQAVVEIVSGDRPCTQLIRWTDRDVYEDLTTRVAALSGVASSVHPSERPRAKVVSVKVCRPCDGVAEVAAHVRQGQRSHALAARLEQSDQRWTCTALELG